jgi:hypothetical protein
MRDEFYIELTPTTTPENFLGEKIVRIHQLALGVVAILEDHILYPDEPLALVSDLLLLATRLVNDSQRCIDLLDGDGAR